MKALILRPWTGNRMLNRSATKSKDRRWLIIPFMLTAIPVCYLVFKNSQPHGQAQISPQSGPPSTEIEAAEKSNPGDFITGQVKMRRNFLNEIVVEGSLRNIARYTNYKDAVLRVDFLSKAGTVLYSNDYKVQGVLRPNGSQDYKFKNPASTEVERISGKILEAEVEK
jgi:hypothetical protein